MAVFGSFPSTWPCKQAQLKFGRRRASALALSDYNMLALVSSLPDSAEAPYMRAHFGTDTSYWFKQTLGLLCEL